jgi:predicted ferric reductase
MITATVGTALLLAVVATSVVAVRRKLSYEWWYAIHFTVYAAIALSWFHMIPAGNDLVVDRVAADYWRGLFALTLALVLWFRVARPLVQAARLDLRVTEVLEEGPGVVSLRIGGRGLERLGARPGQFFLWRFLAGGFWYTKHPFSLSEAPDGESFRITVKALGDHTARIREIPVGTRVLAEGPFGVFTADSSRSPSALLIAGGIGITPIRALVERMDGDVVVLYRVVSSDDIVFAGELDRIASSRGIRVEYVVGDHRSPEARDLLSPAHLRSLVPDLAERDVYACGPPGMIDRIVPDLRAAGVPRSRLHVERFAL